MAGLLGLLFAFNTILDLHYSFWKLDDADGWCCEAGPHPVSAVHAGSN